MKRILTIIGLLVLLGSILFACTPGASEAPAKPPEVPKAPVSATAQGWEAEWATVLAAAKKEGEVTGIYTQWEPGARVALIEAFKQKFGIDLEFSPVGKGTEATVKLTAERRAGLYMSDVIGLGGTTTLLEMKPAGLLAPIEPMLILPEVKDPKNWMAERVFLDQGKYVIGFSATYNPYLDRNTDLVKEGDIKSYNDLLDPRWKGKIVMGDPTVSGSGNSWTRLVVSIWGMDKAKDFMRQLAKQEPMISRNLQVSAEWLARGKYPVGLALHSPALAVFQNAGLPVARIRVIEGGSITASGSCLSLPGGTIPHPNAAKIFINWVLTKEGQTLFAKHINRPSARVDVPAPEGYNGIVPLPGDPIRVEDEQSIMGGGALMELSKEIFGPLLK